MQIKSWNELRALEARAFYLLHLDLFADSLAQIELGGRVVRSGDDLDREGGRSIEFVFRIDEVESLGGIGGSVAHQLRGFLGVLRPSFRFGLKD